jgi:hypothetical protein
LAEKNAKALRNSLSFAHIFVGAIIFSLGANEKAHSLRLGSQRTGKEGPAAGAPL